MLAESSPREIAASGFAGRPWNPPDPVPLGWARAAGRSRGSQALSDHARQPRLVRDGVADFFGDLINGIACLAQHGREVLEVRGEEAAGAVDADKRGASIHFQASPQPAS